MKYEVAIEPGSGAYAFSLTVPDLPGCYAVGKTLEEAMRNLKEASVIWVKANVKPDARFRLRLTSAR